MVDFWTTRLSQAELHPHFKWLAANPANRECFDRWADGFTDVDRNVVHELQTKFSPAFWEVYLFKMFKSLGFLVSRPTNRPDFIVDAPINQIAVEAKVIQAGPGKPLVSDHPGSTAWNREAYYSDTVEKLNGAIQSKLDHYRTYAREPVVKDRPFLLCVNPYNSPHFIVQGFLAMTCVLYQYWDPKFVVDRFGRLIEIGHAPRESIVKSNGTRIGLGLFLEPANGDLSAVFFNPRATVSKLFADPMRTSSNHERVEAQWYMAGELVSQDIDASFYRETMADGGYLFVNPHASRPIDPEAFFAGGVTVCTFDVDTRELTSRTPNPFLKSRVTRWQNQVLE